MQSAEFVRATSGVLKSTIADLSQYCSARDLRMEIGGI